MKSIEEITKRLTLAIEQETELHSRPVYDREEYVSESQEYSTLISTLEWVLRP